MECWGVSFSVYVLILEFNIKGLELTLAYTCKLQLGVECHISGGFGDDSICFMGSCCVLL